MDPSTLHDLWLNLATNSPFLAFVIYNWHKQTNQNESYRIEMKKDREEYERKREEAIEGIRDRYVKVIEDLKKDRSGGIEERLISMEKAIRKLFLMIDKIKEKQH
jgi:hypothetical protein